MKLKELEMEIQGLENKLLGLYEDLYKLEERSNVSYFEIDIANRLISSTEAQIERKTIELKLVKSDKKDEQRIKRSQYLNTHRFA
jgi:hypothetical protein